ncbi:hypothetical protein BBOU_0601 [Bifidobacterium boum]|uniref:Uncharacterized protein n=1 Tax=Bifidobacterium boum TaxID=78343 RepID=A0A086ZPM2_9BIFI|nr:hypothetical protein BBOU_0601 [Bifidobacterium boum]
MSRKNPHAADHHAGWQICDVNETRDRTQSRIEYTPSGTCATVQSVLFHKVSRPQQYVHGIRDRGSMHDCCRSMHIPLDTCQPMFGALSGMARCHPIRSAVSIIDARRLDLEPKAGLQRSHPTRLLILMGERNNPQIIGDSPQYINGHDINGHGDDHPATLAKLEPYRQIRAFRKAPVRAEHPVPHSSERPIDTATNRVRRQALWSWHAMKRDARAISKERHQQACRQDCPVH